MNESSAPEGAPLSRCRWIEHKGKQILFHDLSHIHDPAEGFPVLAQSRAIISRQPPCSVLTLSYVKDARFNKEIVDTLTQLVKHNKPFVKAGAIVGLSGLQRVIYVTMTQLSGRRLPTFDTLEEGKDYLAAVP